MQNTISSRGGQKLFSEKNHLEILAKSDQHSSVKGLSATQMLQLLQTKLAGAEELESFTRQDTGGENNAEQKIAKACQKLKEESLYMRNANFKLTTLERNKKMKTKQLKKQLKEIKLEIEQKLARKKRLLEEYAFFKKKTEELIENAPKVETKERVVPSREKWLTDEEEIYHDTKNSIFKIVASSATGTSLPFATDKRNTSLGYEEATVREINKSRKNNDHPIDLFSLRQELYPNSSSNN